MKILAITLKVLAVVSFVIALMAFGSDLLPVEGISFGGHDAVENNRRFYKIVPSEGVNPIPTGFAFLIASISLYAISALIKKRLVR